MSQAERLARVSEILIELFRSPVPTHFFQTLGDRAGGVVPSDYLAVCLQDPEKGGYLVHSLASLDKATPGQRVFSTDEGLPGRAISTGKPYLIEGLVAEDGVDDLEGLLADAGLRAVLVVPIRRGLEVLGALLFAGRPPVVYGDDLQVAQLLAAGLSAALETSLAYQAAADERSTLGAVLASTADAVIMLNQAGLVLLANAAVRPMLALAPETITGAHCSRSSTTPRCASSSKPSVKGSPSCRCRTDGSRRRASFTSPRPSAGPSAWPPSSAISRCSRTSSK